MKRKTTLHFTSEWKRPRVRLKRENCYHYLGKAKKVQNRKFSTRRNNQDGYFFRRIPLLPCIIKIDRVYNFTWKGLLLGRHISNTVISLQLSGNFVGCKQIICSVMPFCTFLVTLAKDGDSWTWSQSHKPSFVYVRMCVQYCMLHLPVSSWFHPKTGLHTCNWPLSNWKTVISMLIR